MHKDALIPGDHGYFKDLPVLRESEMLALPIPGVLKYLRNAYGMRGANNHTLSAIITRYREGSEIDEIASALRISDSSVTLWVKRASQLHILQERLERQGKPVGVRIEEARELVVAKEVKIATIEERQAEEDSKLADAFREKAWKIYNQIDEGKICDAKMKDQVDAMVKLIVTSRLLAGQSTVNTSMHSIVEHITRLNAMTFAEREALITARKKYRAEHLSDGPVPIPVPEADE